MKMCVLLRSEGGSRGIIVRRRGMSSAARVYRIVNEVRESGVGTLVRGLVRLELEVGSRMEVVDVEGCRCASSGVMPIPAAMKTFRFLGSCGWIIGGRILNSPLKPRIATVVKPALSFC